MIDDSIEKELAALRPCSPSATLREQIASRLSATTPEHQRPRPTSPWWAVASLSGLAAMFVAALYFVPPSDDRNVPRSIAGPLHAELNAAFDPDLPSFWTYRTAASQGPEALDSLFDSHRRITRESKPERARVLVLARYDSKTNPW